MPLGTTTYPNFTTIKSPFTMTGEGTHSYTLIPVVKVTTLFPLALCPRARRLPPTLHILEAIRFLWKHPVSIRQPRPNLRSTGASPCRFVSSRIALPTEPPHNRSFSPLFTTATKQSDINLFRAYLRTSGALHLDTNTRSNRSDNRQLQSPPSRSFPFYRTRSIETQVSLCC